MTTRPDRARVVQQALTNVPPDRVPAVEPDGVDLLDFDGARSAGMTPSGLA